jgi:hypothetical protein
LPPHLSYHITDLISDILLDPRKIPGFRDRLNIFLVEENKKVLKLLKKQKIIDGDEYFWYDTISIMMGVSIL